MTHIHYKPLKIGDVSIGFPVVQAALSGYSDWPMRLLAREHGASYTLCEVMLDQFLISVKKRERTKHFLFNTLEEQPVGGQLMGSDPTEFAQGARKMAEAGFAIVDINFGCPVRKVLGRCRGGFHLSQPEVALEIVRRTREAVPPSIPVTVKMRRGIRDDQQSRDQFFEILDGAFAEGVAAITVHGRTVEQRYQGPSQWSFLREVKNHVGSKIILGSGDLFTAKDCWRMIEETGIDGVSVARGAIGNPWIFEQAMELAESGNLPLPPTLHRQRKVLQRHWDLACELYGDDRAGSLMRKFGIKYSANHPEYLSIRSEFSQVRNRQDWEAILANRYAEDLPGVYPPAEVHRVQGSSCADYAGSESESAA